MLQDKNFDIMSRLNKMLHYFKIFGPFILFFSLRNEKGIYGVTEKEEKTFLY